MAAAMRKIVPARPPLTSHSQVPLSVGACDRRPAEEQQHTLLLHVPCSWPQLGADEPESARLPQTSTRARAAASSKALEGMLAGFAVCANGQLDSVLQLLDHCSVQQRFTAEQQLLDSKMCCDY